MNYLNRLFWVIICFFFAFGYTRIILGENTSTGISKFSDWIYDFAFMHIVSIIGTIIAVLYILLDMFYLNKKLKNNFKTLIIRLTLIIILTLIVGGTHYILEKVINII